MNPRSFIAILAIALLSSCSAEVREQLAPTPVAFGPINQLVVVADNTDWQGALKDSFEYYFSSAYPVLPQPESIFDLRYFSPEDLMAMDERRRLRCYIFLADMADADSPTTKLVKEHLGEEKIRGSIAEKGFTASVAKDKWAEGQFLVYMTGEGEEKLIENIQTNFRGVVNKIRENDKGKVSAQVYQAGVNEKLKDDLKLKMGVSLKVPADYFMAMFDEDRKTLWIRKETDNLSSNIMFRKIPYESQEQFNKDNVVQMMDSLGRYVSSEIPNTFMVINDRDLPVLVEPMTLNNYFALEARGIWEMENDFMGGPFVSYLLHNPNEKELLFVDGFIHAPGEKKREFMQQLEHVIHTVTF